MPASLLRFDRFALDTRARLLHDGDRSTPVQAQVFELLLLLLEHPDRMFAREELIARLWPDVHVADGSLTKAVSRLRALLGDSEVLQTAPGRGYRLATEVRVEGEPVAVSPGLIGRGEATEAILRLPEGGLVALVGQVGIGRSAMAGATSGEPALRISLEDAGLNEAASRALRCEPAAIPAALVRHGGIVVIDDLHLDPRAVEYISAWRRAAPRCRWLVTSPTPLPLAGTTLALRPLTAEEGAALLAARAGLEDSPELRQLSDALDGLPLALALAADRLRTMTAPELLERLDKRMVLLRGLRDALERSWLRLSPEARDVLLRLCSARTPLPLAAAEVVTGLHLYETVPVLIETGWASVQPRDGATRIELSRNARAWLEQQPQSEAQQQARQQLVDWLCELGQEQVAQLLSTGASRWLLEHADLLADLASTQQGPRLPELARTATVALGCRGSVRAAAGLLRRAIERGEPRPDERVRLQIELGNVLRREAQFAEALVVHEGATALAEELGEHSLGAKAWTERALSALTCGQGAQAFAERAVELAEQAEPEIRAHALYAAFLTTPGRDSPELGLLERACEVPLPSRSPLRRLLRVDLGITLHEVGRLHEAEAVFREWLPEFPAAPPRQRFAVQASLGLLLHRTGRAQEGGALLDAAIALAFASGAHEPAAMYLSWRVQASLASGSGWTEALAALSSFVADREPWPAGRAWLGLMAGLVALRERDPFRALARLEPVDGALHRELAPLALAGACAAHAWLSRPEDAAERAERARQAVRSTRGALAADLADAWVLWARRDPAVADPFAAFERCETPWVAPPRQRLLEMQWLTPAALGELVNDASTHSDRCANEA